MVGWHPRCKTEKYRGSLIKAQKSDRKQEIIRQKWKKTYLSFLWERWYNIFVRGGISCEKASASVMMKAERTFGGVLIPLRKVGVEKSGF